MAAIIGNLALNAVVTSHTAVAASNKGHRRISDRVERDCGQYNGAGCTLCQEKAA